VADQPADEHDETRSITELLEQLARELGELGLYQGQLEAARNVPDVRRAVRDGAGALVAATALLAGFVFANVAVYAGLATALEPWQSALVLAGVWVVIGGLLVIAVAGRVQRSRLWKAIATSSPEAVAQLEKSRDDAAESVRDTIASLGPAISIEIVSAAVPSAGGLVEGAGGLVESALDASDDAVEALVEDLPAGSAVNQIWDVALMPGRFGVRIATTIFKRDSTPAETAAGE
jgi:hypothetical protein